MTTERELRPDEVIRVGDQIAWTDGPQPGVRRAVSEESSRLGQTVGEVRRGDPALLGVWRGLEVSPVPELRTARLRELLAALVPYSAGPFRVGVGGADDGRRVAGGATYYSVESCGHPNGPWDSVHAKTPELARLIAEALTALPGLLDDLDVLRALEPEVRAAQEATAALVVRAEAAEAKVLELLELHGGPELDEEEGDEGR